MEVPTVRSSEYVSMQAMSLRKGIWVSFLGQLTEATIKRRKCFWLLPGLSLIQASIWCTLMILSNNHRQTQSGKPVNPLRLFPPNHPQPKYLRTAH